MLCERVAERLRVSRDDSNGGALPSECARQRAGAQTEASDDDPRVAGESLTLRTSAILSVYDELSRLGLWYGMGRACVAYGIWSRYYRVCVVEFVLERSRALACGATQRTMVVYYFSHYQYCRGARNNLSVFGS